MPGMEAVTDGAGGRDGTQVAGSKPERLARPAQQLAPGFPVCRSGLGTGPAVGLGNVAPHATRPGHGRMHAHEDAGKSLSIRLLRSSIGSIGRRVRSRPGGRMS